MKLINQRHEKKTEEKLATELKKFLRNFLQKLPCAGKLGFRCRFLFPQNEDPLSTLFFYKLKMEKVNIINIINCTDKILHFSDTLLRKCMEKI